MFIISDAPYGSEKAYDALRLAITLQKEHADMDMRIFLMADAVTCALLNQTTPQGYYSIERMLKAVINKGGQVKACGTCSEARGIKGLPLLEGIEISTMAELAKWTIEADKLVTF